MARKRYSAEQIIGHLRQAEILISEGKTIGEAARQLSISEQTYRCDVAGPSRTKTKRADSEVG